MVGRYLRLLGVFWKSMLLNELEYRANFVIQTLVSTSWAAWSIASVSVFFLHRERIGDWNFHQALVVIGLFLSFNGLINTFLRPNVERLIEHVRKGTMDFVLIKPVDSQFHASLRQLSVWSLPDVLIGVGVMIYALNALGEWPTPAQAALFALLIVAAMVMLYALVLMLATSSFWFVQVDNILELLFTFYEAGRFPVTIYPEWMRILLTFVVPIAFITTVPAQVVLNRVVETGLVVYALAIAAALFALSWWFWRFALRHYSSASS